MSGILASLASVQDSLPGAERQVAEWFLANPEDVPLLSIHALAAAAGVSVASVSRLARKAGCDGFKELKIIPSTAEE